MDLEKNTNNNESDYKKQYANISVMELDISDNTKKCLLRKNINTILDLISLDNKAIANIQGLNQKKYFEILDIVKRYRKNILYDSANEKLLIDNDSEQKTNDFQPGAANYELQLMYEEIVNMYQLSNNKYQKELYLRRMATIKVAMKCIRENHL